MSGKIYVLLFLILHASVCKNDGVPLDFKNSGKERNMTQIVITEGENESSNEDEVFNQSMESEFESWMNATLYKTVKRYHCGVERPAFLPDDIEERLLVYGMQAWTFPRQDVNLRFSYPMEGKLKSRGYIDDEPNEDTRYLITRFEVILYSDGTESTGHIENGGLLEPTIGLSFGVHNITLLAYQLQIYGVQQRNNMQPTVQGQIQTRPGCRLQTWASGDEREWSDIK